MVLHDDLWVCLKLVYTPSGIVVINAWILGVACFHIYFRMHPCMEHVTDLRGFI